MEQFILDASVGAKWFFKEDCQKEAATFLERHKEGAIQIIVPERFYLEFASVCWKRARKKLIKFKEAVKIFDDMVKLPLSRYPDIELVDVTLENAMIFGISVYDALYISLAEVYVAPLVTADKALYEKCRKRFNFIEYLGNIRLN